MAEIAGTFLAAFVANEIRKAVGMKLTNWRAWEEQFQEQERKDWEETQERRLEDEVLERQGGRHALRFEKGDRNVSLQLAFERSTMTRVEEILHDLVLRVGETSPAGDVRRIILPLMGDGYDKDV